MFDDVVDDDDVMSAAIADEDSFVFVVLYIRLELMMNDLCEFDEKVRFIIAVLRSVDRCPLLLLIIRLFFHIIVIALLL
jgi:hypothetical protein